MVMTSFEIEGSIQNIGNIPLDCILTTYIYNEQTSETHPFSDTARSIEVGQTITVHWPETTDLSVGDWVAVIQVWNSDKTQMLADNNSLQWNSKLTVSGQIAAQITGISIYAI